MQASKGLVKSAFQLRVERLVKVCYLCGGIGHLPPDCSWQNPKSG